MKVLNLCLRASLGTKLKCLMEEVLTLDQSQSCLGIHSLESTNGESLGKLGLAGILLTFNIVIISKSRFRL